jgi:Tfp pilus assembly PilM family ATPase
MVKRSIQTSRPGFTVGIEYDHLAIRAARLSSDGRGSFLVDRLEEVKGNFTEDGPLLEGFRQMKTKLGLGSRDPVVTCLSGKQVFATELAFRKLGSEEMEQALRLELRKTVHFEVATSTLDYEFLEDEEVTDDGKAQVLVAIASNALLNRQLSLLEKAGLKAAAVDVLPIAIANALWSWKGSREGGHPHVALHVGPQIATIVIDGEHSPFFNRTIYFAAEDIFGADRKPDREKRIQSLVDEVSRSMVFYEKSSNISGFEDLVLLGDFLEGESLIHSLQRQTGLPIVKMDIPGKMKSIREPQPGRFDLAVALALRGER